MKSLKRRQSEKAEIWAIWHEAYEAFLPAKKSSDLDPISMQCIGAVKKK